MEIQVMTGGKTMSIQGSGSILPHGMNPPYGKLSTPGNLDGNVALNLYVNHAAKLELAVPSVERVRIIFKEYDDKTFLLIIPRRNDGAKPGESGSDPNLYDWKLHKEMPRVTGLQPLLQQGNIPLREDQWYWCSASIVKDDVEGHAVALHWTNAKTEAREIVAERKRRAEAERQRRARRKLEKEQGKGEK
jgi:hypothetical protein